MALSSPMDRYETDNAAFKIDGYFMPNPNEESTPKELEAVERARAECLRHLRRQIECIEALPVETFYKATNREIPN